MRRPASRWLSMALMLVMAGAATAGPEREAQSWLKDMARAVRTKTYEGVFVYRYRGQLESMRILHRLYNGVEQERLYALSGAPREVIRKGEKVTCILPEARSVLVDWRRSRNPVTEVVPMDVAALRNTYDFRVLGPGRVAGRDAVRVDIEPRDGLRYGYRLWIDAASKLLLRAELVDSDGEKVEQIMFTQIRVRDSLPDAAFEQSVDGDDFTWYHHEQSPRPAEGESRWLVADLPSGFRLKTREWRPSPAREAAAEHHLYSDGLASVSVYIEPPRPDGGFSGTSSMGAISAFGRVLDGHQAVVVGEVPAATVRMIGLGIRRQEAE